ncbi:MAG: fatty acid desaturase [Planctomycetota bacterium]|jgi:fatty acid desaturase
MDVDKQVNGETAMAQFRVAEAQPFVRNLFTPNHLIYWTDFLASIGLAWSLFYLTLQLNDNRLLQGACCLISSFAFLRAILFIHELAHRKPGTFKLFRFVWNLLCGMPMMIPSYSYSRVHYDHHAQKQYGQSTDGEYLPFATMSPIHIVIYLLTVVVLPFAFPLRYVIVTPLSFLHPKIRKLVWERASSLTIDFNYVRPAPSKRDDGSWFFQELGATAFGWAYVYLLFTGVISLQVVVVWYMVVFLGFVLNTLRTLGAHAYRNPGNVPMTLSEQFHDSVDIPGDPITTGIWAPVGLRYHATHHLFPTMPYHSLGTAYRRLKTELPDNRAFLSSTRKGLFDAIRRLWSEARASQKNNS